MWNIPSCDTQMLFRNKILTLNTIWDKFDVFSIMLKQENNLDTYNLNTFNLSLYNQNIPIFSIYCNATNYLKHSAYETY